MVLTRKIFDGHKHMMDVKKIINVYCQHMMMLSCFFYSYLLLQLLLLCGDVESNPGPTKICPKCSLSVHIRIIICSCGYCFKPMLTIACPQCSLVIHKKKSQCVCGYVFRTISHKEDNSSATSKKLAMRRKREMETDDETIVRRAKNRKLIAEKRSSEPESVNVTIARRESNRIAMAGKRASESEAMTIARRESNRIAMAVKRSSKSTIDNAIENFHLKVQKGPM